MTDTEVAPLARSERIDVLDILRGIAILGIFYMNVPFMGGAVELIFNDIRSIGWTPADAAVWTAIEIGWEGTQRGLLSMLFGAGMLVLTAKAMTPDGPVAVADLYYRRNFWLLAFGVFDIFVLLWVGDILLVYALAALFIFPFRTLAPKWLVAIGLLFALFTAVSGSLDYAERRALIADVAAVQDKIEARQPITVADRKVQAEWQKKLDRFKIDKDEQKRVDAERKAHAPGAGWYAYASYYWGVWLNDLAAKGEVVLWIFEAFCAMLIGAALWKWRIIQGGRSARFYLIMVLATYGPGLALRAVGAAEVQTFAPMPKTIWITDEFARLAVSLGHVALVNLAIKSALGARIFAPFKAAGRTAFSLYFMQQLIGLYILFAPFGVGLWGRYGWADFALIATAVVVAQLILANIWMRFFQAGPLEWLWRSLAYLKWQPFRRTAS